MSTSSRQTRADAVVALMAQEIVDGAVVATGVVSPLAILAIAVARATHAPHLTYIACVGSLDPDLSHLHASSEDLGYLDGRRAEVTIPELFDHARRERIDTVFFGAAEIDGHGRTNMTAAGDLGRPTVKFPGLAGAASLRRWVKRPVLLMPTQSKRALPAEVQVASTADLGRPTRLITDLGIFVVGPPQARLVARHAWASETEIASRTGFAYLTAPELPVTKPPEAAALAAMRAIDSDNLRETLVG